MHLALSITIVEVVVSVKALLNGNAWSGIFQNDMKPANNGNSNSAPKVAQGQTEAFALSRATRRSIPSRWLKSGRTWVNPLFGRKSVRRMSAMKSKRFYWDQDLTACDFFCGAGGLGLGMEQAGATLTLAVNHD